MAIRERHESDDQASALTVVVVPLDGGALQDRPETETLDLLPGLEHWPAELAWAPDGSGVFITTPDHGRGPVLRADVDTGAVTRLSSDHGAYSSWNSWSWRWNPWLMAARGYAVLLPDPGLSTGYGHEFHSRGHSAWGGLPFTDLMDFTDAALTRPDLDAGRTAAMGGSFGGYMANWITGHTSRFQAIVSHASLWALEQMFGTTDCPAEWRR